jgi:dihydrofolate synthase/folylpolyglutamate synthase
LHNKKMLEKRQTELFCDWLENYLNYESIKKKEEFSLETMRFLVERLKHPEKAFKSIHVAGSKGKGSVTTMIANILTSSGRASGMYTSPHMLDFTERIATTEGPFSDGIYGKACDMIVPLVESIIPGSIPGNVDPSWFELVTLLGFVTFREARLPWAVIETGLGGRLDATNVVTPEACVITPIELEHTEYLGDTIEKIAFEKAGIIKEGIPVFLAEQRSGARSVFTRTAQAKRSPIFSMDDAIKNLETRLSDDGLNFTVAFNRIDGGAVFSRPLAARLALVGEIQARNAALAAYTVKTLFPDTSEADIEAGLSRAWLPGRFEIVTNAQSAGTGGRKSPIVLDGAHTVSSITLSLETFHKLYPGTAHLVFACAADKDVDSIASLFSEWFSAITITRPGEKKASDIGHTASAFERVFSERHDTEITINPDFETAVQGAFRKAGETELPLLVIGSFYLVAEAKKLLALRFEDRGN